MEIRKIIAFYLRLSRHDEEEDVESNSIGNQRSILKEYLKGHLDTTGYEVREFADDGFSGTSMERPAMQTLLGLVEEGCVYAILVKDLSRFARNYLKTAYYMERVFPAKRVRFICVNDHYDSSRAAAGLPGIDMAFKGIMHDYYCKELSKKLKTARRQQVEKGKCIFPKPPYGYWKSKVEAGVLSVDEETAPVVRFIFESYIQGISAYKIAKELNAQGVEPPNRRLERAGLITFADKEYSQKLCWNCGAVLSILRNQVYVGDMVGNKEERVKICDRNCRKKDREEWIIVEGTHQPIVDKETYLAVQHIMETKKMPRQTEKASCQVFKGKLICGECASVMTKNSEHKGVTYYGCAKCRMLGKKPIVIHSDFLERKVLEGLSAHQKFEVRKPADVGSTALKEQSAAGDGRKKTREEKRDERELLLFYEQYAEGEITREEYESRRKQMLNKLPGQAKKTQEAEPQTAAEQIAAAAVQGKENVSLATEAQVSCQLIDFCIDRIVVRGREDIDIIWRDSRFTQQAIR